MISAKELQKKKEEIKTIAIQRLLIKIENALVQTPDNITHLKTRVDNIDYHSLNVLASKLIDAGYRVRIGSAVENNSYDIIINWSPL